MRDERRRTGRRTRDRQGGGLKRGTETVVRDGVIQRASLRRVSWRGVQVWTWGWGWIQNSAGHHGRGLVDHSAQSFE